MSAIWKNDRLKNSGLSRVNINVLFHFRDSFSLSKFPSLSRPSVVPEADFMRVIFKELL